jgi:hypothetical protein
VAGGAHGRDLGKAGGGALGGAADAVEEGDEAEGRDRQLAVGDVDAAEEEEDRGVVVEGGLDPEGLLGALGGR